MPKFKVERTTELSAQESFEKIKTFLSSDADLKMLDSSYQCHFEDSEMKGSAKGKKFNAEMQVVEDNGKSTVQITVDLPFMLMPFKGMVENTLNKKLTQLLG